MSGTLRKRVVVGFNLLEILDDLLHIEHVGARLFLPSTRLVSARACYLFLSSSRHHLSTISRPPLSVALACGSFSLVGAVTCFRSSLFLPLTRPSQLPSLNSPASNPLSPGLPSLSRFIWFVLIQKKEKIKVEMPALEVVKVVKIWLAFDSGVCATRSKKKRH